MKTASASDIQHIVLPNFLCIGTQKAGTTTLYELLRQHPDIYLPKQKEAFFFDERFHRGLDWYQETYFDKVGDETRIGEVSPHYIGHAQAAERIFEVLGPEVKLILLVRNPAKRAYSEYIMRKKVGYEDTRQPFLEVFEHNYKNELSPYVALGFYAKNLKTFYRFFKPENIKIIFFTDLIRRPQEIALELYEFLDVPKKIVEKPVHANQGGLPRSKHVRFIYSQHPFFTWLRDVLANTPRLKNAVKKAFIKKAEGLSDAQVKALNKQYYLEDIKELEQLMSRDLSNWYR